ncbi:BnaA05g20210D [Brassica napus]|uniref:BnaA05g20210D protein n=1 Tax=Brassica napus TaxID=3708 RepID=A0A078G4K3_BRANA|nr:BnaA05g20210D [Brassica napus]
MLYESENNQARLWDVLAIFAWLNPDIGYVQGMDDICSPMIILLEDEADAFWCFERAMGRVRENTSMGIQTQLDPRLHQRLDLDGGEFLFAIRMLMVLFRRDFSFLDAFYLWEMMWAMEYNPNKFASYKKTEKGTKQDPRLLKQYEAKGLDDVVQILGDIAGNLDARKACKEALKIHEKFLRKANRQ